MGDTSVTMQSNVPPTQVDPHLPLRQNIRMLGDMLGEAIVVSEGENVLTLVAQLRSMSQESRSGDRGARQQLVAAIASIDDQQLLVMAKAFGQFLTMANIAEQHHRIRRRRDYRREAQSTPQQGSLEELLPRLRERGIDAHRVVQHLLTSTVDFVLTAHPTETQRRTMIQKHDRIAELLGTLDRPDLTAEERRTTEDLIRQTLLATWNTDDLRSDRPTPAQEARWGFAVVEQTLWDVVPEFLRHLETVLRLATGESLPPDFSPIRFSSWMGGDRDGNPNVTATVTREVLLLGQWQFIELLRRDLHELRSELSIATGSSELHQHVGESREPYRDLLADVVANLNRDQQQIERVLNGSTDEFKPSYMSTADLKAPLMLCYRSLVDTGLVSLAEGQLTDILRKLACFGRGLLRLDIRQDSARHVRLLNAITRAMGGEVYDALSEEERCQFLTDGLAADTLSLPQSIELDDDDREVLETLQLIAREDPSLFGAYVISMTRAASDILAVYYLQRLAGIAETMRVVPLFETLNDLNAASGIIDTLLGNDWFRGQVPSIEVMIGYSDSAKDAGFLAASWAQYRAQEQLTAVCAKHEMPLILFHGRGGSISRGGASAHQALLSQPPGAVNHGLRVTEQGEVIRYKFGLPGVAMRTLEVYLSAMLEAQLMPPESPKPEWRETMDQVAAESARAYREIVNETAVFHDYFAQTTPIRELQEIAIGSRPAKRSSGTAAGNLRAIPWVFGWTQIRLMLPAWLGTQRIFDSPHIDQGQLRAMLREWVYFRNVIDMQEMVLAKALPDIAEHYEMQLTDDALHPFGQQLRNDLARVREGWLALTEKEDLLSDKPVIQRSIAVRNPYTDVLNLLQVEALQRYRSPLSDASSAVRIALLLTIIGIAAGMRNTG